VTRQVRGVGRPRAERGAGARPAPAAGPRWLAGLLPAVLAGLTVLAQVAYPLTAGAARHRLSVATVLLFAAASLTHAWLWRGPGFALALAAAAGGIGLAVEVVGVATGVPFGTYRYADTLGPRAAGVPVVIPLAWVMMAYPALLVGARISRGPLGTVVAGAVALSVWDLFLDPQMVAEGHWSWAASGPALLGIPLTNYAGWLVTSLCIMALLTPALRRTGGPDAADDRVPYGLYLWVWTSSTLAHAAFLGLPGSALVGGLGMGLVVLVFLAAVRRR
jgi:uncharacterized membrane protein